ncbi:hypothetical protein GCM10027270_26480 [Nocardioides ginkgobilobae]
MTTSPAGSSPSTQDGAAALRLRLDHDVARGGLDGAWWPHSRDLASESAHLVDTFPVQVGRIARLLYSGPDWPRADDQAQVRRIRTEHGSVKLGSFPSDDTHTMVVTLASRERLHLLVVPPETDPSAAEQMMSAAADADDHRTAAQLLAR